MAQALAKSPTNSRGRFYLDLEEDEDEPDHPISRMPPEVLQIIFEFTVEPGLAGFKRATNISHVSHKWRAVTLVTPCMWSHVECSLRQPEYAIRAFWERTCLRVRKTPVVVRILNINNPTSQRLAECRMDKLPNIQSLILEGEPIPLITEVLSASFTPPTSPLEYLSIRAKGNHLRARWDTRVLDRFPPIARLAIYGLVVSLSENAHLSSIKSIKLSSMRIHLPSLTHLSNLTYLELEGWDHNPHSPAAVQLPTVETLKILQTFFWIQYISCPNISTLIVGDICRGRHSDSLFGWISGHHTLKTLEARRIEDTEALNREASHLQHLKIRDVKDILRVNDLQVLILPELRTLEIHDTFGSFPLESFEELVSQRCLPVNRVDVQPNRAVFHPLERLDIYTTLLEDSTKGWQNSHLYKEAKKQWSGSIGDEEEDYFKTDLNSHVWRRVSLRWT